MLGCGASRVLLAAALALLLGPLPSSAQETEAEEDLRQRLTEREDRRRPLEPLTIELGGLPVTFEGELELALGYLRRRVLEAGVRERDSLRLEPEIELEIFTTFGPELSLFFQVRGVMEWDLLRESVDRVRDLYLERGEMWLYSEDVFGSGVSIEIGRLLFEDERRWWWDDEIDAARAELELDAAEISIAVAHELGPRRSDLSFVDARDDGVLRVVAEASFDPAESHGIEFFLLYQDDASPTERVGDVMPSEREDDADAELTWIGARGLGVFDLGTAGALGYWADAAYVVGCERLASFDSATPGRVVATDVREQRVRGWAVDFGASYLPPLPGEPRIFAGYAFGSGDAHPETGGDRSFRQTGLHANEAGFGGSERFVHYGEVLDPELSNLGVATAGIGFALLSGSSLDLVYHYYHLAEPATGLRDARIEADLDGRHRDLGHGVDLVLALEEWEHFELELRVGALRTGQAFGRARRRWSTGGLFAVRYVF